MQHSSELGHHDILGHYDIQALLRTFSRLTAWHVQSPVGVSAGDLSDQGERFSGL